MSPVQGKSLSVQVKEPYGNLDMVTCRLHPATRSVQSIPADNTRKRVWQYIEKESYNCKNKFNSSETSDQSDEKSRYKISRIPQRTHSGQVSTPK